MGLIIPKTYTKRIVIDQNQFFHIKDKLCLDDQNIQDLYQCFRKFDRHDRAYIDFDDFIAFFRNDIQTFIQLPFAQRLFNRIPKAHETKLFFQQFIQGISAFCLLNNQSLLHFIFDFIDLDQDQKISKKDILKLIHYTDPQNGKQTFFTNFSADLDEFPMKQNQSRMDFDHFRINSDRLMFLIWPAFSLQQYLRQKILGSKFWLGLYSKVQKKQIQIKNNEKKEQRMRQKMQMLKNIKIKYQTQNQYQNQNKSSKILVNKDQINVRRRGQNADDSKLLKRMPRTRRRSAPYIKDQFQINNIQSETAQKQ